MAQIEIPEGWRKQVCTILATEATDSLIEWTTDAEKRYEADATAVKALAGDTDPVWRHEVYRPFRDFLAGPNPTGCLVTMGSPPGETCEFYFPFLRMGFYGKILLRPDRKRIVIFSAHKPLKGKLSCE